MSFSAIQILLVFVFVFIVAIDQFDLLESLYQPIVTGAVIGLILGDVQTGLVVGGTYQLMTIGNMPVGGAQPPNAVIGGVMAAVFAIASGLDVEAALKNIRAEKEEDKKSIDDSNGAPQRRVKKDEVPEGRRTAPKYNVVSKDETVSE